MANEETAKDTPSGKEESPAPASLDLNASMEKAYEETVGTTDAAQAATPATPPAPEPAKPEQPADPWANLDWSTFDPRKLPQDAQNKLFTTFQPKLSERAEAFNQQKEALADKIISAWEKQNGGAPAPPSIEAQVKAAIDEGDTEKALLIAQAPLNERLTRIEMAEAQQRAYNTALSFDPSIKENDAEIAQRLSADPQIARMAAANGFRDAPLVLRAVNAVIQNEKMQKELVAVKTTIEAQVKAGVEKAIAERQELVRKAGTGLTQGGRILNPNTDRKMDLMESMEVAWAENAS